jgi:hypothetical protein
MYGICEDCATKRQRLKIILNYIHVSGHSRHTEVNKYRLLCSKIHKNKHAAAAIAIIINSEGKVFPV